MAVWHPDLGGAAMPRRFADTWKAEQSAALPLGYPLRPPERLRIGARARPAAQAWQEFENGVLWSASARSCRRLASLPVGRGSLDETELTRRAGDRILRILESFPAGSLAQAPVCESLLDFRPQEGGLAPRGHVFAFQAEYRRSPWPGVRVAIACDIRWEARPGSREIDGWLDGYRYDVRLPAALQWALPGSAVEAAVSEHVTPWLRRREPVAACNGPLLCAKVLPDGGLHAFPLPDA